jgi:sec-independent protein translocase protein TatC
VTEPEHTADEGSEAAPAKGSEGSTALAKGTEESTPLAKQPETSTAVAERPADKHPLAERPVDAPAGEIEKPFMDHLMELRSRIFISLFVLVLAMVASLVFYKEVSRVLMQPMHDYNARAGETEKVEVFTMRPTEGFVAVLKLGLWGGLVLAFPMITWQIWRFVSPGLYRREKLAILPILTLGAFCFAGGAYFAYTSVLPPALDYLMPWASKLGVKGSVTLGYYLQFMVMVHVAFGIAFETPLVILAFARLGLVTAGGLARKWQYMLVAAFVLGAVLTPPDVVTQLMMAGSLVALYTLSIFLALVFGKRKPREEDGTSSRGGVREHGADGDGATSQ